MRCYLYVLYLPIVLLSGCISYVQQDVYMDGSPAISQRANQRVNTYPVPPVVYPSRPAPPVVVPTY